MSHQNESHQNEDEWHIEDSRSYKLGLINQDISYCGVEKPQKIYSLDIKSDQFKHLIKQKRDQLCDDCLREIFDRHGAVKQCYCKKCQVQDQTEIKIDLTITKTYAVAYAESPDFDFAEINFILEELELLIQNVDIKQRNSYCIHKPIFLSLDLEKTVEIERIEIISHHQNCFSEHVAKSKNELKETIIDQLFEKAFDNSAKTDLEIMDRELAKIERGEI